MCNAIWDTKIELHFGAGHAACCTFTAGRNESKIFQLPDPRSPDPETSWVECPQYDNNMETSSLVPVLAHTNLNATSARTHDLCPVLAQPTQAAVPIKLPRSDSDFAPTSAPFKLAISAPPNCRQKITFYFAALFGCFTTWPKAETDIKSACRQLGKAGAYNCLWNTTIFRFDFNI